MNKRKEILSAFVISCALRVMVFVGCRSMQSTETSDRKVVEKGDWETVTRELSVFIREQMTSYNVVGLSIALVDDQETVWSQGFG